MLTAVPTLLLAIVVGAEPEDTLRSIEEAWDKRAALLRNGEFEWESLVDDRVPLIPGPLRNNPKLLEVRYHLRIDGLRRHFRYHGKQWSENGREIVPLDFTQAFSRNEYRVVGIRLPGQKYNCGYLASIDENRASTSTNPVFWALSELKINFKNARIDGEKVDCRGRPTTLVREDRAPNYQLYWLDPSAQFAVRRAASYRNDDTCMREYELEYAVDENHVAVPSSWETTAYTNGGRVKSSESSKMIRYSTNKKFDDKDFDLEFPNETYVHDFREGRTGGFLIDKNGNRVAEVPAADGPVE